MARKLRIAIVRGGHIDADGSGEGLLRSRRVKSLASGANILNKVNTDIEYTDIHIDERGLWHQDGVEIDREHISALRLLPFYDFYIDTTGIIDRYKGMGHQLFRHHFRHRSDINRVLSMRNLPVPPYTVLRHDRDMGNYIDIMYKLWRTMHTPIVISSDHKDYTSILTSNYHDAVEHVSYLFSKKSDVIISQYVEGDTYTVTTMPDYRGEKYYVPIVHKILKKKYTIYSANLKRHDLSSDKLERVVNLARKAHAELAIHHPVQWDIVIARDSSINIVKAGLDPDFHPQSKFVQSINSTGISYADMCKVYADKCDSL